VRHGLVAAAVIGLAVVLAAAAGWKNSATTDEPYHVLAAWSHVVEGKGDLNPDKPPLAKLVSGLALAPLGLRGTEHPPVQRLAHLPDEVRRFLYGNTRSPETILLAARLPQLAFLVVLLAATYRLGARLFGESAGLLGLVALAFQPLVLAHAFLVHTDVSAAATWMLTFVCFHRWLSGARRGWLWLGVSLGLAVATKFSSLLLIPCLLLLAALAALLRGRASVPPRWAAQLLGAFAVALGVLLAVYVPVLRETPLEESRRTIHAHASQWPQASSAERALGRLAGVSRALAHYGTGLLHLRETDRLGQSVNYFLGSTSRQGFASYLPVAFLLKVSLPFLVLLLAAGVAKRRSWTFGDALLLIPCLLYLLASAGSSYNIGARHLLPLLPLLAIFGGQLARHGARWLVAALAAALALPAGLAFPHYLAHFSVLGGGSSRGARYLNDSNLDWGQDWRRLGDKARAAGWTPVHYVYIGTGDPSHDLPGGVDALAEQGPPSPGVYAVSSFAEAVGAQYLAQLGATYQSGRLAALLGLLHARGERIGGVGTSLTVYRLGTGRPPG